MKVFSFSPTPEWPQHRKSTDFGTPNFFNACSIILMARCFSSVVAVLRASTRRLVT